MSGLIFIRIAQSTDEKHRKKLIPMAESIKAMEVRKGYYLIYRKSFKTKNGKVITPKSGKSFPIWIKIK